MVSNNNLNLDNLQIAILLPCHNEEVSIRKVVTDFKQIFPQAIIYVYDNNSTDRTSKEAAAAGAIVRHEPWLGKGNVVRRMFTEIEADVYIIVDGDDTYDTKKATYMLQKLLDEKLDMVVGARKKIYINAHRKLHGLGNRFFNTLYRKLFDHSFTDIFSGYRVLSRRYVKSFPAVSSGFEIETEMSVHASQLKMPVAEIPIEYGKRQQGSKSKLRTFTDARLILLTFLILFKEIKPTYFFSIFAMLFAVISTALGFTLLPTYFETGLVPKLPTAILATGFMLLSWIFFVSGLILDSLARARLEQKRLWYLSMPQLQSRIRV